MLDLLTSHSTWLISADGLDYLAARAAAYQLGQLRQEEAPKNSLIDIRDGIAEIAIRGTLMRRPDALSSWLLGATDTDEILDAVEQAEMDDDVKAVLLDIDSPGGSVAGIPEIADAVAELAKHKSVYAWTGGKMASAAYWIASQADAIYASPSARVGSIGVVIPFLDRSKEMEKAGLRMEVFASGKYKGAGIPGTTLTDEQRAMLQSDVEELFGDFKSAVLARGRKIPEEALQGQLFSARKAQQLNLAGIAKNKESVRKRVMALASMSRVSPVDISRPTNLATMTLEEQLAEATARLAAIEANQESVVTFQAQLEAERAGYQSQLAGILEQVTALEQTATSLAERNAALEAQAADIETRIALRSAQIAAESGSILPVAVTAAGDEQPQKPLTAAEVWNRQFTQR